MSPALAVDLARGTLWHALLLAAPVLGAAMLVGVTVSILQAVTSIQEQTLTFVPKIAAISVVLAVLLPWMLRTLVEYAAGLFRMIPSLVS